MLLPSERLAAVWTPVRRFTGVLAHVIGQVFLPGEAFRAVATLERRFAGNRIAEMIPRCSSIGSHSKRHAPTVAHAPIHTQHHDDGEEHEPRAFVPIVPVDFWRRRLHTHDRRSNTNRRQ